MESGEEIEQLIGENADIDNSEDTVSFGGDGEVQFLTPPSPAPPPLPPQMAESTAAASLSSRERSSSSSVKDLVVVAQATFFSKEFKKLKGDLVAASQQIKDQELELVQFHNRLSEKDQIIEEQQAKIDRLEKARQNGESFGGEPGWSQDLKSRFEKSKGEILENLTSSVKTAVREELNGYFQGTKSHFGDSLSRDSLDREMAREKNVEKVSASTSKGLTNKPLPAPPLKRSLRLRPRSKRIASQQKNQEGLEELPVSKPTGPPVKSTVSRRKCAPAVKSPSIASVASRRINSVRRENQEHGVHPTNELSCICGRFNTKNKSNLSRHIRYYTYARKFTCQKCPLTFAYLSFLGRHYLSHHKDVKMYNKLKNRSGCNKCGGTFKNKEKLRNHRRISHGVKSSIRNRRNNIPVKRSVGGKTGFNGNQAKTGSQFRGTKGIQLQLQENGTMDNRQRQRPQVKRLVPAARQPVTGGKWLKKSKVTSSPPSIMKTARKVKVATHEILPQFEAIPIFMNGDEDDGQHMVPTSRGKRQ